MIGMNFMLVMCFLRNALVNIIGELVSNASMHLAQIYAWQHYPLVDAAYQAVLGYI